MAELIKVDGTRTHIEPANGTDFSFDEVRPLIGADTIQMVKTHGKQWMLIDEEGKLKEKPINYVATGLYQYGKDDPIVGDVLVCAQRQVK